jgi:hypothetical protein
MSFGQSGRSGRNRFGKKCDGQLLEMSGLVSGTAWKIRARIVRTTPFEQRAGQPRIRLGIDPLFQDFVKFFPQICCAI